MPLNMLESAGIY